MGIMKNNYVMRLIKDDEKNDRRTQTLDQTHINDL